LTAQLLVLAVVTGIGLGSIYILVALSYTLVLATSGVFNFAQGALVMAGAVGSYVLSVHYGVPGLVALLVLAPAGAIAGFLSERIAVHPFLGRGGNLTEEALVSTLGLGLIFVAAGTLYFGVDERAMPPYVSSQITHFGLIPVRPMFILMFVSAGLITVVLDRIIVGSGIGSVLRAVIFDPEGAALHGINVGRVVAIAFALAGVLAVIAGFLLVPFTSASVFVGDRLALFGFVAMAVGGFGSFRGAVVGGLVVGLITEIAPVFINPLLVQPLLLVFMIVVLVTRPGGLFGTAGQFGTAALREV
jgi:branched-subunit amino acid ABC-type transport system permease component